MKRAGTELQRRLQGKTRGVLQPRRVVFESGALLVLADACPQPPDQMRGAVEIDIDEGFAVHHLPFAGLLLRAPRMRCGRFSSSSCRPTGSFFGSTSSEIRSAMPMTNSTVA